MKSCIISVLLMFSIVTNAQFVQIPDPALANWLNSHFSGCMTGNMLDTTCSPVVIEETIDIDSTGGVYIQNLEGLQYLPSLKYLYVENNTVLQTPDFQEGLRELNLSGNVNVSIQNLPSTLRLLYLKNSNTISLPDLPVDLEGLYLDNNPITEIPILPAGFIALYASGCEIAHLPNLPEGIETLIVSGPLKNLTTIPSSLKWLSLTGTDIRVLPDLHEGLIIFHSPDSVVCYPELPVSLLDIDLDTSVCKCIPNYVPVMYSSLNQLLNLPLCVYGDNNTNPCGCQPGTGTGGQIRKDTSILCTIEALDLPASNIQVNVFDNANNFVGTTSSNQYGHFFYYLNAGDYHIEIPTNNKPYEINCSNPDDIHDFSLTSSDTLESNVNFLIQPKTGHDIGYLGFQTSGFVFPGEQHQLTLNIGDIANHFGMKSADGVNGTIQLNYSGPVQYVGSASAAIPVSSGNTLTYTISDFGAIDLMKEFSLFFSVDTTAQAGDVICFTVDVDPLVGDNNPANNNVHICYDAVNSYDPNQKTVWPRSIYPNYDDWINYKIEFQNTGNAPAMNIRLEDTLSSKLDLSTFEVMGYKHYNNFHVKNNKLIIYFPDIILPDSTADLEGSKGFFHYRLKPLAGISIGDSITNTAHIFFDFNSPIVTNTAITKVEDHTSIESIVSNNLQVYPNPFSNNITVNIESSALLRIYDMSGKLLLEKEEKPGQKVIDLSSLTEGVYVLEVYDYSKTTSTKIVKY